MAIVERTIISAGGGNYTSIAGWLAATNLNGGADIWKGVISDSAAYDETNTITVDGTSATSYVWLTADVANRHAGTWDTGKARINYSGTGTAVIEIQADWCRVDWMQVYRSGGDSSDEGIRVRPTTDVLIDYCVFGAWAVIASGDGVYTGNWNVTRLRVSNSVFFGWTRADIHLEIWKNNFSHSTDVDHCALGTIFSNSSSRSALRADVRGGAAASQTLGLYNTWASVDGVTTEDVSTVGIGVLTLNGSHNAYRTSSFLGGHTINLTNTQTSTDDITDTPPATAGIYVTNAAIATFDAAPVAHANSVILGNGTNRQGSEPDVRQDFSVAINGARPTTGVDIGPFQISGGGPTPTWAWSIGGAAYAATIGGAAYTPSVAA